MTAMPRIDRRLNWVVTSSIILLAAVILFALFVVPRIFSSGSTIEAVDRNNALQSCRATFRVAIDDASADLQVARARLDAATNEGLELTVTERDPERLLEVLAALPDQRAAVADTAAALETETDRYRDRVELSRTDPEAFLDECSREDG